MNEVTQIKDKQEDMDGKLDTMKKENEALWREVVSLRQKHLSQQKIVNKLIQLLVSLVSQPRRVPGGIQAPGSSTLKRQNFPLAIEGVTPPKERKISGASDIHQVPRYDQRAGPTIQEVLPNEDIDLFTTETQPKSGMFNLVLVPLFKYKLIWTLCIWLDIFSESMSKFTLPCSQLFLQ